MVMAAAEAVVEEEAAMTFLLSIKVTLNTRER